MPGWIRRGPRLRDFGVRWWELLLVMPLVDLLVRVLLPGIGDGLELLLLTAGTTVILGPVVWRRRRPPPPRPPVDAFD